MNFDIKKLANPYTAFAISWFLCLVLYAMGWSDIFPPLTLKLFFFLSSLIVLFGCTGIFFNRLSFPTPRLPGHFNYERLFIINILLYGSNFLYSGIPLLNGARADDFGIPTIIVIATTLNCFTSVFGFYYLLLTRQKRFLLYVSICLILFVMAFSRGNIMMSMVTMFFLWINVKLPILNVKKALIIGSGLVLVMYLFGVAGNYRTINGIVKEQPGFDNSYNSKVILGLGQATDSFNNSFIPGEFFWTYLYITSPLSNLQYNINKNLPQFTVTGAIHILTDELLFDAVSKRIDDILGRKRADPDLIVEQLTVPTTLAGSYNYGGWNGMTFFMVIFWLFPLVYSLLIAKNPLGVIGLSTLCTVYFFSIFDNMFILTGLTFQIFYPILFNFIDQTEFKWTSETAKELKI